MNTKQSIFIHGLFGESILPPENSKVVTPYFLDSLSQLDLRSDDVIVAYSFGARKLLSLIHKEGFPDIKHIHIVSAHIGCKNRVKRIQLEDHILEKMNDKSFLSFWNELPLFEKDANIQIDLDKLPFYRKIFDQNRLSNSPDYNLLIEKWENKMTLHCGEFDHKIKEQYIKFKNTVVHPNCSHRGPLYLLEPFINGVLK